jgi:hypothetical protein
MVAKRESQESLPLSPPSARPLTRLPEIIRILTLSSALAAISILFASVRPHTARTRSIACVPNSQGAVFSARNELSATCVRTTTHPNGEAWFKSTLGI